MSFSYPVGSLFGMFLDPSSGNFLTVFGLWTLHDMEAPRKPTERDRRYFCFLLLRLASSKYCGVLPYSCRQDKTTIE